MKINNIWNRVVDVRSKIVDDAWYQIDSIPYKARHQVWDQLYSRVYNQVQNQVKRQVRNILYEDQ